MRSRLALRAALLGALVLGACERPATPAPAPGAIARIEAALPRFLAQEPPDARSPALAPVRALLREGRDDEARAQLEPLAAADRGGEAQFLLGWLHDRAGRHALALPWLARAIERGPTFPDARQVFYLYGRCLQETGDLAAARVAYAADSRLFPDQADGRYRLALLDLEAGDLERCEERARACLERFARPRDLAKTHALLAEVHLARDRPQEARAALERCVETYAHYEAYYKLSQLCARLDDPQAAARYLQEHERWRARAGR